MPWRCFLPLFASPALLAAQAGRPAARTLRFDLTLLPATRDSYVVQVGGTARGYAVWQYEIRTSETGQEVRYTAHSELEPFVEEQLRVRLDRLSGAPVSSFHRTEQAWPENDTTLLEHDLDVKGGAISGQRRVGTRDGQVRILPTHATLPPGAVLSYYRLYAAAVAAIGPGDSASAVAWTESGDSLTRVTFVAERPTTIDVPAGRFAVLPIRNGTGRVYVTRDAPRRVIKGESLDGQFVFALVHTGPVVPTEP